MFRLSAQGGAREQIFEKQVRRPALSTTVKKILGYSTRNGKFKRLEPHFQLSATGSASKEGTETAVALPHSRECTKEPISALPNYGSKEKFGAKAELRSILQEKLRGRCGSSCQFDCLQKFFVGSAAQVTRSTIRAGSFSPSPPSFCCCCCC